MALPNRGILAWDFTRSVNPHESVVGPRVSVNPLTNAKFGRSGLLLSGYGNRARINMRDLAALIPSVDVPANRFPYTMLVSSRCKSDLYGATSIRVPRAFTSDGLVLGLSMHYDTETTNAKMQTNLSVSWASAGYGPRNVWNQWILNMNTTDGVNGGGINYAYARGDIINSEDAAGPWTDARAGYFIFGGGATGIGTVEVRAFAIIRGKPTLAQARAFHKDPMGMLFGPSVGYSRVRTSNLRAPMPVLYNPPSLALSGTAAASIAEGDVVTGGKTIVLTLTGDTWISA